MGGFILVSMAGNHSICWNGSHWDWKGPKVYQDESEVLKVLASLDHSPSTHIERNTIIAESEWGDIHEEKIVKENV